MVPCKHSLSLVFVIPKKERIKTSDSSLKNSWAAYGPGNSNHLEIFLMDSKDHCKKCMVLSNGVVKCVCVCVCVSSFSIQ